MKMVRGGGIQPGSPTGVGEVRKIVCVVLCALLAVPMYPSENRNFGDLSIEELLNESVTSVSKREQKLGDAAAAIAVLSSDDIRRSGVTNIADALRLVPGMNVSSVSSSQWAISARGFNNLYANKLLVLVDGRAVYTPLFAGVYWDLQQPMLEDVDRVEVIRGPGATVWGANAVNGVINIVSRSARETQGTLLFGGAGDADVRMGGVRHGGVIGSRTYYRVFGTHQAKDSHVLPDGREAGDGWDAWHGGMRVDHHPSDSTQLTWQSDVTKTQVDDEAADGYNFNMLGRLTHQLSAGGNLEAQAYVDHVYRDEALRNHTVLDTFDFTFQHALPTHRSHDLMWGFGYRFNKVKLKQTNPGIAIRNGAFNLNLYSFFLQDEIKLIPDTLTLTAGIKLEHNDFTGFEVQPSVRAAWKPTTSQTVWAAISRSIRTPSALEDKDVFNLPFGPPFPGPDGGLYIPTILGNANPASEVVLSYELGWRIQPNRHVSVDLATFYNRYSKLILIDGITAFTPGVPFGTAELPFVNLITADTYGGEASLTLSPTNQWRLNIAHSVLLVSASGVFSDLQLDPKQQTIVRSSHDFGSRLSLDLQLRRVGNFDTSDFITTAVIPAYTAFDMRLSCRPTDALEVSLVGQNLLDRQHPEQGFVIYAVTTEVPRRVHAKIDWRF